MELVVACYFAGVSPRVVDFNFTFCNSQSMQNKLIRQTLRSGLESKYAQSIEHKKQFLKCLISQLEHDGTSIDDEVYELFCALINGSTDDAREYRHRIFYSLTQQPIVIREHLSNIARGTTGLHIWKASYYFSRHMIETADVLFGVRPKCILELGAGLGLCGILATRLAKPQTIVLSDVHRDVLSYLCDNVEATFDTTMIDCCSKTDDLVMLYSNCVCSDHSPVRVEVMELPWNCSDQHLLSRLSPDLIIATDVCFALPDINELTKLIQKLFSFNPQCKALIANTIRDVDTAVHFEGRLDQASLPWKKSELLFSNTSTSLEVPFHAQEDFPVFLYEICS